MGWKVDFVLCYVFGGRGGFFLHVHRSVEVGCMRISSLLSTRKQEKWGMKKRLE